MLVLFFVNLIPFVGGFVLHKLIYFSKYDTTAKSFIFQTAREDNLVEILEIQTQADTFAKLCVSGIEACGSLEDFRNSDSLSSFQYVGENVDVWKLPAIGDGLVWPSFLYDSKQEAATSTHLLYVRTDETSTVRRDAVLRFLQEGRSTVVVGSAGSGKSSEMNVILVQLIQKMDATKGNWPKAIFFRYPEFMISFVYNADTIDVNVEKSPDLHHVFDVTSYAKRKYPGKAVLLLEMREITEIDPHVCIPTYIALSPRKADERVKTMSKSKTAFLIAPPPDKEQVLAMAQSQLDCPRPGFDAPSVLEVKDRIEKVGPLLRYVLGLPMEYEAREKAVKSIHADTFFADVKTVNIFNIPPEAGKYIAAVLEGTEPVYARAESKFIFLSDFAAEVVGKATLTDSEVRALEKLKIKYLVAEHAARQYFKGKRDRKGKWVPSNLAFNLKKCDVCIDVGYERLISPPKNTQHKSALMKLLPKWDREVDTDGMYLQKDVKLLEEGCLYRPRFHHFALGDAMIIDHEEKKIFFIQSTALDVADHSVNLSTLEMVMTKLELLSGGDNGDYTMWIIFCADWSRVQTHGSCFIKTADLSGKVEVEQHTPGLDTLASSEQTSRKKGTGKKKIKFYKNSCIAEDGTINYDAFELSTSKKGNRKNLKPENLSQYLSPQDVAIMKRCHVLIVRCQYLPALNKFDLN